MAKDGKFDYTKLAGQAIVNEKFLKELNKNLYLVNDDDGNTLFKSIVNNPQVLGAVYAQFLQNENQVESGVIKPKQQNYFQYPTSWGNQTNNSGTPQNKNTNGWY